MKEAGGAIVNISSDGDLRGWAGCWIYDATKTDLWSVTKSMYLGNVVLLTLNFPLIPYIAWLIALPQRFLGSFILFFSLIGVYLVSFNTFDIDLMIGFAMVAIFRSVLFSAGSDFIGFRLG